MLCVCAWLFCMCFVLCVSVVCVECVMCECGVCSVSVLYVFCCVVCDVYACVGGVRVRV